ncbi:hypothetical protein [Undibacterium sp. TS12]|nr:hypothetical protein [Undibacterium sp. TS12]MCH8618356.1 hypothetical protein [Undibacterium sp. TS12]
MSSTCSGIEPGRAKEIVCTPYIGKSGDMVYHAATLAFQMLPTQKS